MCAFAPSFPPSLPPSLLSRAPAISRALVVSAYLSRLHHRDNVERHQRTIQTDLRRNIPVPSKVILHDGCVLNPTCNNTIGVRPPQPVLAIDTSRSVCTIELCAQRNTICYCMQTNGVINRRSRGGSLAILKAACTQATTRAL